MGNRAGRRNQAPYGGDPYLNQYGTGYGYGAQPGLAGYGPYTGYGAAPAYTITTPAAVVQEPWAVTQWTEYYIPTVGGRQKRPVIYIAAPLPAANPCAGGFGGGFGGGLGGGLGGPICGVPIGFGMTTTVGGVGAYTDDIYAAGPGYGATLGYGPTGIAGPSIGGLPGPYSRGLNRGPYRRPF